MFDGKATKSARRGAGLTGRKLAERVGVTNVTISRIENARQSPSRDLAERIARVLGVPVRSLYREPQVRGTPMPEISREEQDILAAYRRLDRLGQAKVWAFVMGLASGGSSVGAGAAAELAQAAEGARRSAEARAGKQARRA